MTSAIPLRTHNTVPPTFAVNEIRTYRCGDLSRQIIDGLATLVANGIALMSTFLIHIDSVIGVSSIVRETVQPSTPHANTLYMGSNVAPRSRRELLSLSPAALSLFYTEDLRPFYSGASEHYQVERNTVLIKTSDGSPSRRPPPDQGYEFLPLDSAVNISWRRNIGILISGAFLQQIGRAPQSRTSEFEWSLGAFPIHYVLVRRIRTSRPEDSTGSKRSDVYLYGGKSRFASPAEFAAHAVWLMRGAISGTCACKYCSKSPQKVISAPMEDAVISAYAGGTTRQWERQVQVGMSGSFPDY